MKKTNLFAGVVAAGALITGLSACTVGNVAIDNVNTILAGNWYITSVNDSTVKSQDEQWPHLELNTQQGTVSGYLGCNFANGRFTYDNRGQINFQQVGTTRMMCPEIALEDAITSTLPQVRQYFFNQVTGALTLSTAEGKPLMVLSRINPRTIDAYKQIY